MTLSEAIEAVGKMIRGYANGGANAGRSYIGTLAALLCEYPRSIALKCADPIHGVATKTRFLPTPADIVAWCEPHVETMQNIVDHDARTKRQLAERARYEREQAAKPEGYVDPVPKGYRCNVFVPSHAPQYQNMVARTREANARDFYVQPDRAGVWVPLGWLTEQSRAAAKWQPFTKEQLEAIYRRAEGAEDKDATPF